MVMRWSAGSWLEDQDMWRMSGIFRSVWLLNKPKQHLSDVQISPQLDALYRDGELLVNLTIAAADEQLAGWRLKSACGTAKLWSPPAPAARFCAG
jgi:beta-galactosidase